MQQQQQTSKAKNAPTTIKGAWKRHLKASNEVGVKSLSLKQFARDAADLAKRSNDPKPDGVVADAQRWLEAKRPGGTDAERKARRAKRKEQQGIRGLKPISSEGKKKGRG